MKTVNRRQFIQTLLGVAAVSALSVPAFAQGKSEGKRKDADHRQDDGKGALGEKAQDGKEKSKDKMKDKKSKDKEKSKDKGNKGKK
ncbi:hypothetical protein [Terasakiella pusilla]|uniref:hypothetical protein n=2 Tax=Terasakiella pusilla TaxID=64973 RepID=UPI000490EBF5|nr:hypothetical protein [Terasakiella pusilla]